MRRALGAGFAGGCVASLVTVLVPFTALRDTRVADYAGLVIGLLAVHLGMRATRAAPFRARLAAAFLIASVASLCVGAASFVLFRDLQPGLLAERYQHYVRELQSSNAPTARTAAELGRLAERRASYLEPGLQAITAGGTLFFFALLLGGYAAFQTYVAERLPSRPAADRSPR